MLTPNSDHELPEMTVEVAQAAFPKGNAVMKIRDELGPLFAGDEFASLYPTIGQPAERPSSSLWLNRPWRTDKKTCTDEQSKFEGS